MGDRLSLPVSRHVAFRVFVCAGGETFQLFHAGALEARPPELWSGRAKLCLARRCEVVELEDWLVVIEADQHPVGRRHPDDQANQFVIRHVGKVRKLFTHLGYRDMRGVGSRDRISTTRQRPQHRRRGHGWRHWDAATWILLRTCKTHPKLYADAVPAISETLVRNHTGKLPLPRPSRCGRRAARPCLAAQRSVSYQPALGTFPTLALCPGFRTSSRQI